MAALNLTFEGFQDPDVEAAKFKATKPPLAESESQTTAYKYVGTTAYSDSRVFLILRSFLQPSKTKSVEETVESILELLPENAPHSNEVACVGLVIMELADQIPYHHPSHIKLARVMEELCRSSKTTKADYKGKYFCFHRFHEELIMDGYGGPDPDNPAAWPNLNAFIANIEECHIWPTSPYWAIRAMRDAFEVDSKKEEDWFESLQDQKVLAAAQYILWNGQNLFKQVRYLSDEGLSELGACKPGPLYSGKSLYSLDRWHFWKKGFQASTEDTSSFSDECRSVARKVVGLMDSLEHSMMF